MIISVILACRRMRQESQKFEASLGYIEKPSLQKQNEHSGHWWLTPVILATQEAEIRRISSSKPDSANSSQDPILKKHFYKKDWWSGSRCRPWVQTPIPQKISWASWLAEWQGTMSKFVQCQYSLDTPPQKRTIKKVTLILRM
jgi:hypothetical protein